jgi:HK97 family phage major capsid protein
MHESTEVVEALDDFRASITDLKSNLVGRIQKLEQRAFRFAGSSDGPTIDGESIGALVVKDSRFKTLAEAGRGIAQVHLNRRLVTKSTVTIGPSLKPGIEVFPSIAELPGPAPTVADLIGQRPLGEGTLQFVRQKAPHPVAGVQVNQGDVKAEGDLSFETVTISPATLAIWIPASRQALRDVAGLSLLINSELLYAVKILEENEILNGDGSQGHLTGILPAATAMPPTAGDSPLDAVARALGYLSSLGVQATGIVMNPSDWLHVMLSKSTTDEYLLGSPAMATAALVWGVPLALSTQIAQGTFLAGNFVLGCELAFRELATFDISTEHADFFTRNLIAIRAEESLVLAIKQPPCFVKSTLPASAARNGGVATRK